MNTFLQTNKTLVTCSIVFFIFIPIFGFNFLISLISNVLLLVFLVPLLIFLISLIYFNSLKSKVNTCNQCGAISFEINNICIKCGANLNNINENQFENLKKPSETTIEIKAEEVN